MGTLDLWRDRSTTRSLLDDFFGIVNSLDRAGLPQGFELDEHGFMPQYELIENDDGFVLSFDLPGVKKDEVNIEVSDNKLLISGERKREDEVNEGQIYRRSRTYGKFQRSFTLPDGVNDELIEASFEDGVLRVAVPKAEVRKPKKIAIGSKSKGLLRKLAHKDTAKAANS